MNRVQRTFPMAAKPHELFGCGTSQSTLAGLLLKAAILLLVANEVRGLVLAAPVLYAMYAAGGTLMGMWIGVCSLAGILVSIAAPLFIAKKLKPVLRAREAGLDV